MIPVPTLAEIVAEPTKADGLPGRTILSLLGELVGVQHRLTLRMLAVGLEPLPPRVGEDRLLTTEEAAAWCQVSPFTMKRWARRLPYNAAVVVLSRTCVRWSAHRLEQVLLDRGARPRRKAATG